MCKKIIKISIVFCIIVNIALVCSMKTCASPVQEKQVNKTTDVNETSTIESAQSVSADAILDEMNDLESVNSGHSEGTGRITVSDRDLFRRIVNIGDLPADYDPSLVLRKGRTVTITSRYTVNSEKSLIGMFSETINEDIYDDSGQNLLIPKDLNFRCAYKVYKDHRKVRVTMTAIEMYMLPPESFGGNTPFMIFLSPPAYYAPLERMLRDFFDGDEEFLQQHEQLFLSPAIGAELIFNEETKDKDSESEKVAFSKNASGDLTIIIEPGYKIDLQVKKDILFSAPYIWSPEMNKSIF